MGDILIEKMQLSHLEEIKDILEAEFDDFWNYNILKKELEDSNAEYIIAKVQNEIIGFAGITIIIDFAELNNIVIKKSCRGKGISKKLLDKIEEIAKEKGCNQINLEVAKNNLVAINLYEKFGFKEVGLRKGYYNGEDGILYSKEVAKR